jgi:GTP-binding protein EngB required for normal cell division
MKENYQILIEDETKYLNNNINSYTLSNLNEEEILKAKENGFILIGKTGTGKTSLLNVLFGDDVGKVGYSSKSETKITSYYCIKEKIGDKYIYFCIIDTPGLFDTNGEEADDSQKKEIIKLISRKKIKIKGLLFLANFQNERFDASEQISLIQYNSIFPLKDFWKHLIIIFTHYYGDPDGDSKEEIQQRSKKVLSNIFSIIMNKVKNISNPINYEELNRQYINVYSRPKNDKHIKNNKKIRNDLILEIEKYTHLSPMFSKIQIFHFKKYEIKHNDRFVYDCDVLLYLDANDNTIFKNINILKRYPNNNENEQSIELDTEECKVNEEGNLVRVNSKKENVIQKYKIVPIFGIICALGGIVSFFNYRPISIVCFIGVFISFIINKSSQKKHEDDIIEINKIIEEQKINEEIKKYIENE